MRARRFLLLVAGLCFAVPCRAVTGAGESNTGLLETVPPSFSAVAVSPAEASRGEVVTLTFQSSEPLATAPKVTVQGRLASPGNKTAYSAVYWVSPQDPIGFAPISIRGVDQAGNPGSIDVPEASVIVAGPIQVPLAAWPLAVSLALAGMLALKLRRRAATAVLLILAAAPGAMAAVPIIENVQFVQRANETGTEVVITYDLVSADAPCNITVSLSKDGGIDAYPHPVISITGDVAAVVPGTGKTITWDIAADYPNEQIPAARLRVRANDGLAPGLALPLEMIEIPPGNFLMGRTSSGDDEALGNASELPVHLVYLTAYAIGKYEVTNQQFCDVLNWAMAPERNYLRTNANEVWTGSGKAYVGTSLRPLWDDDYGLRIQRVEGVFSPQLRVGQPANTLYSLASHPVNGITWYGAVAFANWLSEMEGRSPVYDTESWTANFANDGYHLPTEAQWERAAAWDGTKHWVYGFTSDTLTGNDRANYAAGTEAVFDYVNPLRLSTSPVGWFDGVNVSPNGNVQTINSVSPVGAYDMCGNVREWCHDVYGANYYSNSPESDPVGPESSASIPERVIRGGSYRSLKEICRTAERWLHPADISLPTIGFRVAR